ncbi:hypothetical protein [Chitinophaga filiformis]|nr:hypothetical protein [Chitinophaga filiformis]
MKGIAIAPLRLINKTTANNQVEGDKPAYAFLYREKMSDIVS